MISSPRQDAADDYAAELPPLPHAIDYFAATLRRHDITPIRFTPLPLYLFSDIDADAAFAALLLYDIYLSRHYATLFDSRYMMRCHYATCRRHDAEMPCHYCCCRCYSMPLIFLRRCHYADAADDTPPMLMLIRHDDAAAIRRCHAELMLMATDA